MQIYYFVHVTGTDPGMSGIPRLVKALARELLYRDDVELKPVAWSARLGTMVHAEQKLLDNLALHGGPGLKADFASLTPVEPKAGSWLLIAEAPHLASHDADYPSLIIDEPIGWARGADVAVAAIVHDILPLTHLFGPDERRAFVDMGEDGESHGRELLRLRFAAYAHALALADLLLPVSRTTEGHLREWLIQHGRDRLPPMATVLIPEGVLSTPRGVPFRSAKAGTREFLALGTVSAHKNQLAAMAAFLRLIQRRPDLDIRLNVVGSMTAEAAVPASVVARRSNGRIVLRGFLPDEEVETLAERARACVFVSLAEGYGMPVAESLWRGKPCLASNDGSIAEIAMGGGCLTVDPRDLSAIEAGFETLAADDRRYDALLEEIAARPMRTWTDYGAAVVGRLAEEAGQASENARAAKALRQADGRADERPGATPPAASRSAELFLAAADLDVAAAYVAGREHPARRNGVMTFDRETDGEVGERVLFFGPYVWLPAGAYAFTFEGKIDGALELSFTADEGRRRLADLSLESFARPVLIEIDEPVDKFEIVGSRTPALERLVLSGVRAEYRAAPERAKDRAPTPMPPVTTAKAAAGALAPLSQGAAARAVHGRDDEGWPLRFPCTIAASALRTPDAYGAGDRNRLRSGSTIAFRAAEHGRIAETNLFFGPYYRLDAGDYAIRLDGALEGALRIRLTQNFASETLVETTVKSFDDPVRLKLARPVEKFEILGDRTPDTRAMTLRAIEITRGPEARDGDGGGQTADAKRSRGKSLFRALFSS